MSKGKPNINERKYGLGVREARAEVSVSNSEKVETAISMEISQYNRLPGKFPRKRLISKKVAKEKTELLIIATIILAKSIFFGGSNV